MLGGGRSPIIIGLHSAKVGAPLVKQFTMRFMDRGVAVSFIPCDRSPLPGPEMVFISRRSRNEQGDRSAVPRDGGGRGLQSY